VAPSVDDLGIWQDQVDESDKLEVSPCLVREKRAPEPALGETSLPER
jgi:hypothetical protein